MDPSEILKKIPEGNVGWGLILGTLVLTAILWYVGALKAKREKVDEDKQRAGEKGSGEAKDSADKIEDARKEKDDFLNRG